MKIKRNASFKLFTYGKNKDKYQIRMRVTFLGQRLDIGTGCQINSPSVWDETLELVKSGYKGPKGETAGVNMTPMTTPSIFIPMSPMPPNGGTM